VNPIGLTRAEEAHEHPTEAPGARPPAPPGTRACQVVLPDAKDGNVCGAAADLHIVWSDGDRTPACLECAARMRAVARSFSSNVRLEPLAAVKK
jgi:hypothetical protein